MYKILCEILDSLEKAEMPIEKLREAIKVARGVLYGRSVILHRYGKRMQFFRSDIAEITDEMVEAAITARKCRPIVEKALGEVMRPEPENEFLQSAIAWHDYNSPVGCWESRNFGERLESLGLLCTLFSLPIQYPFYHLQRGVLPEDRNRQRQWDALFSDIFKVPGLTVTISVDANMIKHKEVGDGIC